MNAAMITRNLFSNYGINMKLNPQDSLLYDILVELWYNDAGIKRAEEMPGSFSGADGAEERLANYFWSRQSIKRKSGKGFCGEKGAKSDQIYNICTF